MLRLLDVGRRRSPCFTYAAQPLDFFADCSLLTSGHYISSGSIRVGVQPKHGLFLQTEMV